MRREAKSHQVSAAASVARGGSERASERRFHSIDGCHEKTRPRGWVPRRAARQRRVMSSRRPSRASRPQAVMTLDPAARQESGRRRV